MIHVIVKVTYDYYRFQENLHATTDIEEARAFAKKTQDAWFVRGKKPVIEDQAESAKMDLPETEHIWIQTFAS